jgi:Glycosyltransferase family 92
MSLRQKLASITPGPVRETVRLVIRGSRRMGYARARYPRPLGTRPDVRLAICAIFKDEASYLAEWVTFHRLMGVDRFYLYDNDSSDDWREVLAPELGAGIVRATAWPGGPIQGGVQRTAYSDCIRRHRRDTRWIAFIDIDEFLFSPLGRPLPDVLRDFDRVPAVVVNWRNFGTGGWEHRPNGLVTENYLTRAPDDFGKSRLVKSIVYPRKTSTYVDSIHHFHHFGQAVGEDRQPVRPWTSLREPSTTDLLRINHYYSKSAEELQRKLAHKRILGQWQLVSEAHRYFDDTVRDETILQFLPALKEALAHRG